MKTLKGKTALVTGATGFIGTNFLNRLQNIEGLKLVALSRKHISMRDSEIVWICASLDCLNRDTWLEANVDNIDIVFHLGAFTPKTITEFDLVDKVYSDNLIGTRTLLDNLPNLPERVVFASTLDVYDLPQDQPVDENSPVDPVSLYGASKLFCEKLIKVHAEKNGYDYAILRYGHIFGPGEGAYKKLIPEMIKRLINNEAPVLYGEGNAERDFLFVSDVVEASIRAACSHMSGLGPVNIVSGKSLPIREIAEMLIDMTGFTGDIVYLKEKSDGYSLRFNNDLMFKLLGRWDFVTLKKGLAIEVEHYKEQS